MGEWFGSSLATIGWVAATTAAMYVTTLLSVRIAGRRTLAQLSAFDIIVTIALGSVIATTTVQKAASYAQGTTVVLTLLVLQTILAAARQRFSAVARIVDFSPEVVVDKGRLTLRRTPLGPQLTEDELMSRLREKGVFGVDTVRVVILEPGGSVSLSKDDVLADQQIAKFHGG